MINPGLPSYEMSAIRRIEWEREVAAHRLSREARAAHPSREHRSVRESRVRRLVTFALRPVR